jgi:cellulose biosynthesis protein BcsQ
MARDVGKIISVNSAKGGVGKTIMTLNLAGVYYSMQKKVLL